MGYVSGTKRLWPIFIILFADVISSPAYSNTVKSVAYANWYPMCLFIAPESNGNNETIKGMVDDAAACEVNLTIFPITTKPGLPDSAGAINSAQRSACNLKDIGISGGSSSTCCSTSSPPGQMCGSPGVAGCAEVGGGAGGNSKFDKAKFSGGGHGFGGFSQSGSVSVSLETNGACDTSTVNHEAIGHSAMGAGHGPEYGEGIGTSAAIMFDKNIKFASLWKVPLLWWDYLAYIFPTKILSGPNFRMVLAATGSGGGAWTSAGCSAFRSASLPNDGRHRYDPNRETYYVKQTNPEYQFDLMGGQKLFRDHTIKSEDSPPPIEVPPHTPDDKSISNNKPQGNDSPNYSSTARDSARTRLYSSIKEDDEADLTLTSITEFSSEKHKKKSGTKSNIDKSTPTTVEKKPNNLSEDDQLSKDLVSAPETGSAKGGSSVFFDDSAAKGRPSREPASTSSQNQQGGTQDTNFGNSSGGMDWGVFDMGSGDLFDDAKYSFDSSLSIQLSSEKDMKGEFDDGIFSTIGKKKQKTKDKILRRPFRPRNPKTRTNSIYAD